jgi:hypothetical protein
LHFHRKLGIAIAIVGLGLILLSQLEWFIDTVATISEPFLENVSENSKQTVVESLIIKNSMMGLVISSILLLGTSGLWYQSETDEKLL